MITDVAEIAELVGRLTSTDRLSADPSLRRSNRIKTVYGSLAIEQNSLTLDQVTAVLNGKRVLAPPKDITQVRNAFEIYERLEALNPYSIAEHISQVATLREFCSVLPLTVKVPAVLHCKNTFLPKIV